MSASPPHPPLWPIEGLREFASTPSAALTLAAAFSDTVQLLFRPFHLRRWIRLSAVCLLLGGGASSAAFQWSLGSLPVEIGLQDKLARWQEYAAENSWVIVAAICLGMLLGVLLVYVRAVCRFVLIDAIVEGEVRPRQAARELRPQAHSYFFWVLGVLGVAGTLLAGAILLVFPYLRTTAAARGETITFSIALAALLLGEMALGLFVALLILLTDDLALPIMYAERLRLPAAWRRLGRMARSEVRSFAFYVLLRFAASVGVGVVVLLVLFPILLTVFSGATIIGALVLLTFRLLGLAWVWNAVTLLMAALAVLVLIGILLVVLGIGGMPGQVFLQTFGIRFVAQRLPTLQAQLIRDNDP